MKWISVMFLMAATATSLAAPEKVIFGQPSALPAEPRSPASVVLDKDSKQESEGRKARVVAFPNQQTDSRSRPYGTVSGHHYETTENRFGTSHGTQEDENRLLSLLPSFSDNGMQVGLDFKLPFFSIPYSRIFSGLRGPSSSGFLGSGIFGSSLTDSSAYGSEISSNSLPTGGLSSGLATMTAMAVTAALLYPKITSIFGIGDGKGIFRTGNEAEDLAHNVNSVLNQFNIDGESCLKVALCSLGNARRGHIHGRDSSHTTPVDIIEDLMNLSSVKSYMAKVGLVQARDFGGSGGDCDYFNNENKCPMTSQTWNKMLASLTS